MSTATNTDATTKTSAPTERSRRNLDDLRLVMTNLSDLIDAENAALAGHDIDAVKALSANKWTLTRNYRNQMQAIADAPDILQILEDEERNRLRDLGLRLRTVTMRNERLLSANIAAANRVMHAVVDGVRQAQERNAVYGKSGSLKSAPPDGRPMAVSFNKEL
jgi:flagellar biosynthesis/type III secretory pathway chaperone